MSKWTLRQQRTQDLRRGERQEHTAAMRAARYVRRHAWQFHGAGVEDAVRDLTSLETAIFRAFKGFAESAIKRIERGRAGFELSGPVEETAHGLTVVGWKGENGCAHCPACRPMGATMITTADLERTGVLLCLRCGTELGS